MGTRNHSKEFKKDVISYHKQHPENAISTTATKFEIAPSTLRDWLKADAQLGENAFVGSGNLTADKAEAKAIQKKLKDLEEENAILKKALAIFSRRQKVNMISYIFVSKMESHFV